MRFLSVIIMSALFIACSSGTPENLEDRINQLVLNHEYSELTAERCTEAIALLEDADPAETQANIDKLKEETYLKYARFLEYKGPESSSMRDRMTSALEQYIEVLNINPENEKARAEIKQIMGIYETMPDRSPGEEILNDLREFGFDY